MRGCTLRGFSCAAKTAFVARAYLPPFDAYSTILCRVSSLATGRGFRRAKPFLIIGATPIRRVSVSKQGRHPAEYARFGGAAFPWPGNRRAIRRELSDVFRYDHHRVFSRHSHRRQAGGLSTPAPCGGTDRSPTNDRELSDAELATLWPRLDPALKLILLTTGTSNVASLRQRP